MHLRRVCCHFLEDTSPTSCSISVPNLAFLRWLHICRLSAFLRLQILNKWPLFKLCSRRWKKLRSLQVKLSFGMIFLQQYRYSTLLLSWLLPRDSADFIRDDLATLPSSPWLLSVPPTWQIALWHCLLSLLRVSCMGQNSMSACYAPTLVAYLWSTTGWVFLLL